MSYYYTATPSKYQIIFFKYVFSRGRALLFIFPTRNSSKRSNVNRLNYIIYDNFNWYFNWLIITSYEKECSVDCGRVRESGEGLKLSSKDNRKSHAVANQNSKVSYSCHQVKQLWQNYPLNLPLITSLIHSFIHSFVLYSRYVSWNVL